MEIKKIFGIGLLIIAASSGLYLYLNKDAQTKVRELYETNYARLSSEADSAYPIIETNRPTQVQSEIVRITRQEYAARPVSYDKSVLKYTDGIKEPWCADFISWVMQQSGVVYNNPNSGNWRIPGVLTLKEYYENQGRYIKANDTYTPKLGDVAIYIGEKTLDGRSGQHANIVLNVIGNTMTTIGGNERGRMRISVINYKIRQSGLVGFGTLPIEEER